MICQMWNSVPYQIRLKINIDTRDIYVCTYPVAKTKGHGDIVADSYCLHLLKKIARTDENVGTIDNSFIQLNELSSGYKSI